MMEKVDEVRTPVLLPKPRTMAFQGSELSFTRRGEMTVKGVSDAVAARLKTWIGEALGTVAGKKVDATAPVSLRTDSTLPPPRLHARHRPPRHPHSWA